ncbi:MAG: hypothetical protein Q4D04_04410, partial [Clostridia bacterium]|nr:hypothetical protein [Clostridia bacterium]
AARSAKERWQCEALTERFLSRQQGITLTERFPRMASDRAKLRDRGVNLLGLITLPEGAPSSSALMDTKL